MILKSKVEESATLPDSASIRALERMAGNEQVPGAGSKRAGRGQAWCGPRERAVQHRRAARGKGSRGAIGETRGLGTANKKWSKDLPNM